MSRLGNKLKAGFFPTPNEQVEHLKRLISFEADSNILDPTAGTGTPLQILSADQPYNIKSYGVEIDKGRYKLAAENLSVCANAPIESMVISRSSFGLIFLNPPYDETMIGIGDTITHRKEEIELYRSHKLLMNKGILIYILSSKLFANKRIAQFLSRNFEECGLMRFTDPDYEAYEQCIFIGKKKTATSRKENKKMTEFLLNMANPNFVKSNVTLITSIIGRKTWTVPYSSSIKTFYSKLDSKNHFYDDMQSSKGFNAFKNQTQPRELKIGGNPILPLNQGQLALLLASGGINGLIGANDSLHLIQGQEIVSQKESVDYENDNKTNKTLTVEKIRTTREISLKVLTPEGELKKLI